ncbi:MAG: proton-conducting transporter membrane subunit [Bacteroidales bacterium]
MINDLNIIICLPVVAGIIMFLLPDAFRILKGILALAITLIFSGFAIKIFGYTDALLPLVQQTGETGVLPEVSLTLEQFTVMNINSLTTIILLFVAVLAPLICLYSIYKEKNEAFPAQFYSWFLITLGSSAGTILADNLLLFLFFWGVLGFTLYKLIKQHDAQSSDAAKKTLIIVGSSDAIMIIGIGLLWNIAGTLSISELSVQTSSGPAIMAFLLLGVGSFTKAGAFPFHTWIPSYTGKAHGVSSAYMPASFDKLIGIYFLVVLCSRIFVLNQWLTLVLLILGVATIIIAVMMALIQHNYKKLLGYHAVSQVGYMVVGIALGTPLGIAAGLFHMFNNAVYKSGLFLSATTIERKTGTVDLDKTGGLASKLPLTFIIALIFALSISGIPPLNGFASKWMIYQGIVDFGQQATGVASQLWIVWLALAVLGSALTLASFIKFISGIFLGRKKEIFDNVKEVSFVQWMPVILLAAVCIGFGAFSTKFVVKDLFMPATGVFSFLGIWDSALLLWLVIASIIAGILIYWIGRFKNMRRAESFVGGEKAGEDKEFPVTGFYLTVKNAPGLRQIYDLAERKWFDLYDLLKGFVLWTNKGFSYLHTGVLTTYTFWVYAGFVILLLLLIL